MVIFFAEKLLGVSTLQKLITVCSAKNGSVFMYNTFEDLMSG